MIADLELAVHLVSLHLEPTARELGVTQAEAHVLAQLEREGPQTVGQLVDEFGHKRSTLTNILDRLEGRGLIRREINARDRRTFRITLTATGSAAAVRVSDALGNLEAEISALVSARDIAGVRAVAAALAVL